MQHTHTHSPAVSTFSPVSSLSSNDLRTCAHVLAYTTDIAQNELICGYVSVVHTSSSFRTHTHILIPFEDCELTGLKVDIAHSLAHTHACTHYTHTQIHTFITRVGCQTTTSVSSLLLCSWVLLLFLFLTLYTPFHCSRHYRANPINTSNGLPADFHSIMEKE